MSIIVVGGMTLDDLVLPGGEVHRRVPGGNALYCALGARLWGVRVEVVSFVGVDYPAEVLLQLQSAGIGIAHLAMLDTPSIRLWILYEEDGRRQIHLQHGSATLAPIETIASAAIDKLLATDAPDAAHVAALPVSVQRTVASAFTAARIPFTLDSLEAMGSVGGDLQDYLQGADLAPTAFLPSRDEFDLLFGEVGSLAFRAWASRTSTSTLVIKDGRDGSLVSSPPLHPGKRLPALECDVIDPTGAGDAYCGGFAAGMSLGRPAMECAAMGTVSASLVVEQVGARGLFDATPRDVQQRRATLGPVISSGDA